MWQKLLLHLNPVFTEPPVLGLEEGNEGVYSAKWVSKLTSERP
jgi:hypothetical protein